METIASTIVQYATYFITQGTGFLPQGGSSLFPSETFVPPEIWSENNRKTGITKEICITTDFAPPEKIPGRKRRYII